MAELKYIKLKGKTVVDFERTGNKIDDYQKEIQMISDRFKDIVEAVQEDESRKKEFKKEFAILEKRLHFLIGAVNDEIDELMTAPLDDEEDE